MALSSLVRILDVSSLFSLPVSILSLAFILHSCFLKDEFNEQDRLNESQWKFYARSRFLDTSYVLVALFFATTITVGAMLIGRLTGISDLESSGLGISLSATLQVSCDMYKLNKQEQKSTSGFPTLDHFNNRNFNGVRNEQDRPGL
ncbi:hypothetical protein [Methylobacterium sp. Leaf456]|uniref:hypothetical protein n=1 Tax=Methylobacterium sp. Leaf456 TaxID=1736382 RepID=UPI0012E3505C|nr:hypothetical protein [Methylobacterium sp. Leaf456]